MNKKNNIDIEFILVEPSHPGNIGACARAIKNMGFKKLALVNPRKKITEEAGEVVIAAKNNDKEELKNETADLLYHLIVTLQHQNISLQDVYDVLEKRHKK